MPIAAPIRSRPRASTAGWYSVARSAPVLVRMPTQRPAGVDDRGHPVAAVVQQAEGALRISAGRQRQQLGGHHLAQLGEAVDAVAVGLGDHADRPAVVVDDDDGAVRALGQQAQRMAGRGG